MSASIPVVDDSSDVADLFGIVPSRESKLATRSNDCLPGLPR